LTSIETAKKIAINSYIHITNGKKEATIKLSKTQQYDNVNTYYTFVFENNDWIVVSANDATEPIFAFSLEGNYTENHSPQYIYWMHTEYDLLINHVYENNISNENTKTVWDSILTNNFITNKSNNHVPPLISTRWGQNESNDDICNAYNFFVSEKNNDICCGLDSVCPSGCIATAMAQIMRYWAFPNCPQFEWNNMPNELLNVNNPNYAVERNAVAKLIRQCGLKTDMIYCMNGCSSGTTIIEAHNAFKNDFGYSNSNLIEKENFTDKDWEETLRNELTNNRPVYYQGTGFNGVELITHAFICDGFYRKIFGKYTYHFNFGWRGNDNAHYLINDKFGFKKDQMAITNIQPVYCNTSLIIYQAYKNINFPTIIQNVFYNPEAGNIYSSPNPILIEDGDKVHYKAYNEIVLENFETEDGAGFIAEIIPCSANNCDFDNDYKSYNAIVKNNQKIFTEDEIVLIYPNPSKGIYTLELDKNIILPAQIKITTILGKVIYYKETLDQKENIDISAYPSGIYFVSIASKTNTYTKKIIKN
jgi:hypothetical protein